MEWCDYAWTDEPYTHSALESRLSRVTIESSVTMPWSEGWDRCEDFVFCLEPRKKETLCSLLK